MSGGGLIGRDAELTRLAAVVAAGGTAHYLSGDAGVGKSALLAATAARAAGTGATVVRAFGSEYESSVGYAALNQLLRPLQSGMNRLKPDLAQALSVAVGFGDGPPPPTLLVCNAALTLVDTVASEGALVLIIDDISWIDRASAVVVRFIARRLAGTAATLLVSARTAATGFLRGDDFDEMVIEPLDEQAAGKLVDGAFPAMSAQIRRTVLDLAQGNPLALMELPSTVDGSPVLAGDAVVPLSERLQASFSARIADLPPATRHLLLLAVFEGAGDLRVLRRTGDAGESLAGLAAVERTKLLWIDDAGGRINFWHPLIRSAVVALSTHEERRAAHLQLARALADDEERHARHLALTVDGPDPAVADAVERAAHRAMTRGDVIGAVGLLVRAAELSPLDADRGRRWAEAAYLGAEAGGTSVAARRLLSDAYRATADASGSLHAANAAVFLMLNGDGDVDTAHRLLVGAIESADHGYRADDPALIEALHTLLLLSWYGSAPRYWEPYFAAIGRLRPGPPPLLELISQTFPDPVRTGAGAIELADVLLATLPEESDPTRIMRLGTASVYLDRLADSRAPSWRVVQQGRAGGAARRHIGALMHLCLDGYLTGRWDEVVMLANEGRTACDTEGFPFFAWYFHYHAALVAAGRGQPAEAHELADTITRWAVPRGVHAASLFAEHPRTLAAIADGDFDAAFRYAEAMSPAGVLAAYVPHCTWVMFDLVEAAVHTGRTAHARAHVQAMLAADIAALSPRMALLVAGAQALIADDVDGLRRAETMVASPDVDRWHFDVARVRLVVGERLRRAGAPTRALPYLLAARDGFAAMNAAPWVDRARKELRANGYRPGGRRDGPAASTALTDQELRIAELAAAGLTNKQIAQRLLLSHRTVGAHLYRIYPKLGVVSRAGLARALTPEQGVDVDRD